MVRTALPLNNMLLCRPALPKEKEAELPTNAIVGKPNSGKSTLLNALLMEEKAIVSEIPGTTRDSIEDTIVIDGIEYRFIDTAGLRETTDIIELLGIKKTHEKIDQASVILLIDDITDKQESVVIRVNAIREMLKGSEKRLFILINKIDAAATELQSALNASVCPGENEILLFISAKKKNAKKLSKFLISD